MRRGASPICRSRSSTGRRAKRGCWSTTATTWWPSEPACRAESAGICTRSRPTCRFPPRGLKLQHIIARVADRLAAIDGLIAAIAREQLDRLRELNRRINELEREIRQLIASLAPALLTIPGCGALTAAKLVGETAGAHRFRSKAAYARWNGTAPQPASSGNTTRVRLNRGGNRQVNAALHRIAVTQARTWPQGRDYIAKRIKHGNTKAEALRLLRRRLSDVVYRTLLIDEPAAQPVQAINTHKT